MQLFCVRPSGFLFFVANARRGATKRRNPIPMHRGKSVRKRSSRSISIVLILIVAKEKMWGAVADMKKTPKMLVTVVSKIARETLPFAWVIIVTPDESVVGTTQKS